MASCRFRLSASSLLTLSVKPAISNLICSKLSSARPLLASEPFLDCKLLAAMSGEEILRRSSLGTSYSVGMPHVILAYDKSKCIDKTVAETNDSRYGSSFVTFYKQRNGILYASFVRSLTGRCRKVGTRRVPVCKEGGLP